VRSRHRVRGRASAPRSGAVIAVPVALAYFALLALATWRSGAIWLLAASLALNLATFFLYAHDKHRAGRGGRRIPENTLHVWSLAGGWPGAWLAQQVLRHKSAKLSFRVVYWGTVALHCSALAWALRHFQLLPALGG
jgi:uncharacterized membrane protein YsdA (DUF1294 family)